ncbi:hypothetical protein SAMN04487965_0982 [Microbulbifer donghaiensis]|uniref:Uncharacterized protein n=1 Tax=Microbulbifer donghaiensis TaxID=494016 RepID=A0A1M4XIL1_9GAMM|nr:hypothetical protein [Microbulbifer donghaiensis]SHE93507.1 hypothetical protein SAMN04487965_0982 [Microbulbifer donghaiensis]
MGLHVNAISDFPMSEERDYYLYVLDYYNWDEPISNTLMANLPKIATLCAQNNAVMVQGLPDSHFYSEVLSWVKINGQDPSMILPALMITTVHPRYFIEANCGEAKSEITDSLIFLNIREICKQPDDVVNLIQNIFIDIKEKNTIENFAITKELRANENGALVDALILEPNFAGLGVNIKKLVAWGKARLTKQCS